jgi:hypothetical protein
MLPKKKSQKVDFETGISYEVVEEDGVTGQKKLSSGARMF